MSERREINVPERPHGYESIIPPEVFEATKHLAYAFDNLVQVYHKSLQDTLGEAEKDKAYGAVQFLIFDDEFNIAMDSIQSLVNIHSLNKQDIDEVAKEKDCTVEQLATMMVLNNIADKLKFILTH